MAVVFDHAGIAAARARINGKTPSGRLLDTDGNVLVDLSDEPALYEGAKLLVGMIEEALLDLLTPKPYFIPVTIEPKGVTEPGAFIDELHVARNSLLDFYCAVIGFQRRPSEPDTELRARELAEFGRV